MRPLSCVMSDFIFSLRASQEGTKLVPIEPDAISMSVESPPSAAPSSFAVALHHGTEQQTWHRDAGGSVADVLQSFYGLTGAVYGSKGVLACDMGAAVCCQLHALPLASTTAMFADVL